MKKLLLLITLFSQVALAQKLKKSEKAIIADLKTTIDFLASDKMEGRLTGTKGEKLAADYITSRFKQIGLLPKGEDNSYIQHFTVNEGLQIMPATFLMVNEDSLHVNEDFFPVSFSGNGKAEAFASPAFKEKGMPWFLDIKEMVKSSSENPHAELEKDIRNKAKEFLQKGATALLIYNSGDDDTRLVFDGKSALDSVSLPVVFLSKNATAKYLNDNSTNLDLKLQVELATKSRTGNNVIGYLDNGAQNTVIIGAHYDHLGHGEDGNTLSPSSNEIYNGADDNASGTAAVIELAKLLKAGSLKNNNYLFICFSGEEAGLYGSRYFTTHPTVDLQKVNYMINCDMVGRLNNDSKVLSVGGFGTSPQWSSLLPSKTKFLNVKFDSSGIGPSDHTSFYLKNIPVLFFFTGTHPDYHKPSDDADKINLAGELRVIQYIYQLIGETNKTGKLSFLKTRDQSIYAPKFTVTLGIMPDYTFQGKGLRIDAVLDDKIASKAGILAGDVITRLGTFPVTDINNYMSALSNFKKGDSTKVTITRGANERIFDIIF